MTGGVWGIHTEEADELDVRLDDLPTDDDKEVDADELVDDPPADEVDEVGETEELMNVVENIAMLDELLEVAPEHAWLMTVVFEVTMNEILLACSVPLPSSRPLE